jgi:tRNA pseudouridine38-40 synthase
MTYDQKKNYKIVLEYDGTNYHGWQRQKGLLTIQEVVEARLAIMSQTPVRLIGAGRTDAGVHARGQVANFSRRSVRSTNTGYTMDR